MNRKGLLFKTIYIVLICILSSSFVLSSSSIGVNEDYYAGLFEFINSMYRLELGEDGIRGASLNGAMIDMPIYSCFELASKTENESFAGIGASLEKVRYGFIIVSINPSSPAHKAGLESGDVIYRIDKQNAAVMSVETFRAYMAANESALFEIIDNETGLIRNIRIASEAIYNINTDYVFLDNAGYIRINRFEESTSDNVQRILNSMESLGIYNLVLDLRDLVSMNIEEACEIADILTPGGGIARTQIKTFNASFKESVFNVSILVNEGTAGAGEVMASAIPGKVYGGETVGKAFHIIKYPVFTEKAYIQYAEAAGSYEIKKIVNYLKGRKIEVPDENISGYLNLAESVVYNSERKEISSENKIVPDVEVKNTDIGYMDYKPDGGMINIRRNYSEGSINYDVFMAKKILAALGIYKGEMNVKFESDMTSAVNKYKTNVGYPADGILDMNTQAMLNTYAMQTAVGSDECVKAALEGFLTGETWKKN